MSEVMGNNCELHTCVTRRGAESPMLVRGFTLVELMVTISIASIILAIAVPSFVRFIDQNAIRGACDEIRGTLSLARSEAIRGSRLVHVAPTCATGLWSDGWAVFADTGTTADCFDAGDLLIMRANVPSRNVQISLVASPVTSAYMSYTGAGVTRMANGAILSGTFTCNIIGSTATAQSVVVNTFGRVK